MELEEAILKRRSVRSYKEKKIQRKKIQEIFEFAKMAPSARNKQDWEFVVVDENEKKERIYRNASKQSFILEAPVLIAGVATDPNYTMSCGIPGGIVDLAIALDHLSLKAADEGLRTCWIGAFDQEKAKEVLEIPDEYEIISLMTLGYPEEPLEKKNKRRKDVEKIISYNEFSD